VPLEVRRRPAAKRDLVEIWLYIAEDNEHAADRVLQRIDEVMRMLSAQPSSGRMRSELGLDIRSFPVGNNVVFYTVADDHIDVLRVLSSYRDIVETDFASSDQ
jgi:toxin ParE1/3/4